MDYDFGRDAPPVYGTCAFVRPYKGMKVAENIYLDKIKLVHFILMQKMHKLLPYNHLNVGN